MAVLWAASEEMETVLNRTILVLRLNCWKCSLYIRRGKFSPIVFRVRRGVVCVDMGRTNLKNKDRPDISGGVFCGTASISSRHSIPNSDCSTAPSLLEFLAFVDQKVTMIPHCAESPHRGAVNPSTTHVRESLQLLHFFHPRIVNDSHTGSWEKMKRPSQIWVPYAQGIVSKPVTSPHNPDR